MVPSTAKPRFALTPLARDGLIILACVAAQGLYLLLTYVRYGVFSFPLDDAWIYQVYARNLAQSGQWAFVPGLPSSGSTSILWTLLVAPAYLFLVEPRWWTQGLGLLSLIAASLGSARLFAQDSPGRSLAVGLAVALEWHLIWAAASGMETGLFAALLVWFWVWLRRRDPARVGHRAFDGLALGMWGGALMLARPEGVLALGVAGLYGLLCTGRVGLRLRWAALAGLGFTAILLPFFLLNLSVSGTVWPNTFYAKQMEYAPLWARPYPLRLLDQVWVCLVGAQLLLLPGLLADLWGCLRRRPLEWGALVPWAWVVLHWALYALRLPVTYQHGRYAIPVIPIIVVYGVRGCLDLARPRARQRLIRLPSLAWLLAVALLFPLTLGVLGAPAYGRDASFIENEMVATAQWVADHSRPDDVIAAHDIGALGYFAPRRLVDLAGLVSPDVVPFMNDDQRLAAYIVERGADYLVVFPGWSPAYRRLVADSRFCPVWSAADRGGYVAYSDAGPMTVYRVSREGDCAAGP